MSPPQLISNLHENGRCSESALSPLNLSSSEHQELLEKLNKSYSGFRFDYFALIISTVAFCFLWFQGDQLGMILVVLLGLGGSIAISLYEHKRRTIQISYNLESINTSPYRYLNEAVSTLAECESSWACFNPREIRSPYESKINSGATRVIHREPAGIGIGQPPWIETNINVPVIQALGITMYFMPECILIYGKHGVDCIAHDALSFTTSVVRYIESDPVPSDAEIVDYTWAYANKDGGPDRRFKENIEIPVCLYGALEIKTDAGLSFYLQTSRRDVPLKFSDRYAKYIQKAKV